MKATPRTSSWLQKLSKQLSSGRSATKVLPRTAICGRRPRLVMKKAFPGRPATIPLEALEARVASIPVEDIPSLLGELERLRALLYRRLAEANKTHGEARLDQPLLTVDQAAQLLNLKPSTVYELVRRNRLPHVRLGKHIRLEPHALSRYLAQQQADSGER